MMHIRKHSEYSWSLIDPRPVLKHVDFIDEYIVFWNGIVMPHAMALNIALERFNVYPTPSMKVELLNNYKHIYYCNGFGERPEEWSTIINNDRVYTYLRNTLHEHIAGLIDKHQPHEVLAWFDYARARKNEAADAE